MYIKFDAYGKRSLGPLFKNNEDCPNGKRSKTNINLKNVNRVVVTHLVKGQQIKDEVKIDGTDIIIPFRKEILKTGTNEFELTAYMKNGDIKTSQTNIYDIVGGIKDDTPVSINAGISTLEFIEYTIDDIRVYPIIINMDALDVINSSVKFKQYDFGTSYIVLQISDNNKPLQLNNVTIMATFLNSEKNIIVDAVKYDNINTIISNIDGVIKILVPDEVMRYRGTVECELMIFENNKRSTSPRLTFEIVSSIINHEDMDDIVEDDRYSILTTLLDSVGVLHVNAEKLMKQTEGLVTETEALKISTELVKNETIATKNAAEQKIIDCEARMTTIEDTFESIVDGSGVVTTPELNSEISKLVDSAPTSINTIGKIARSIGNDSNYDTTIKTLINTKSDKHEHPYKSNSYIPTWAEVLNKPTAFNPTTHEHSQYALDSEFKNHINNHPQGGNGTNDYNQLINKPGNVTTTTDGFMTSADKVKLNGIAQNANNYVHPDTASIRHVSDAEKTAWNSKSTFSGNYNDLTNKPTIPTVDVNKSYVDAGLNTKVDKVVGKSLISDSEITRLAGLNNTIVVDNLSSTSITGALSAKQGKILNDNSNNLTNRVNNVEYLKESQNPSYTTNTGYLACDNTKNGVIKDIKMYGKTLVNLSNFDKVQTTPDKIYIYSKYTYADPIISGKVLYFYNSTGKKVYIDIYENGAWKKLITVNANETIKSISLTSTEYFKSIYCQVGDGWTIDANSQIILKNSFIILDSQLSYIPSYFEGLKSVGEDVDVLEVLSTSKDMKVVTSKSQDDLKIQLGIANISTNYIVYNDLNKQVRLTVFNSSDTWLRDIFIEPKTSIQYKLNDGEVIKHVLGYKALGHTDVDSLLRVLFIEKTNKKQILYYDTDGSIKRIGRNKSLKEWDYVDDVRGKLVIGSGQIVLNGSESGWVLNGNNGKFLELSIPNIKNDIAICDKLPLNFNLAMAGANGIGFRAIELGIRIKPLEKNDMTLGEGIAWLQSNPITITYQLVTPIEYDLVPLNLDSYEEQTMFAINSNVINPKIDFNITNYINNLIFENKKRVKYLETKQLDIENKFNNIGEDLTGERTDTSHTTNIGYLIGDNTKNGVVKNIKMYGKTLVNLEGLRKITATTTATQFINIYSDKVNNYKPNTVYTIITNITKNELTGTCQFFATSNGTNTIFPYDRVVNAGVTGMFVDKVTSLSDFTDKTISIRSFIKNDSLVSGLKVEFNQIVLEGDYTQNPPAYFEGLKSVGEDVDVLEVLTRKEDGNLFDESKKINGGYYSTTGTITSHANSFYSNEYINVFQGYKLIGNHDNAGFQVQICEYDSNKTFKQRINIDKGVVYTVPSGVYYIRISLFNYGLDFKLCVNKGTTPIPYQPYKGHKKQILYYDTDGSIKSVSKNRPLREWDYVDDIKGKLVIGSGQIVLNGSESINISGTANGSTVNTLCFTIVNNDIKLGTLGVISVISDKFLFTTNPYEIDARGIAAHETINGLKLRCLKSELGILDTDTDAVKIQKLKTWLTTNNVTVTYQLVSPIEYSLASVVLDSYEGQTAVISNSGAIKSKMDFNITKHIVNTVNTLSNRINNSENDIINLNKNLNNVYKKTEVDTKLSGKVTVESGKVLSSNDYTTAEKNKLAGLPNEITNYQHPSTHPASMITVQDTNNYFAGTNVEDVLKEIYSKVETARTSLILESNKIVDLI